jgi:YHS domain-containing protein
MSGAMRAAGDPDALIDPVCGTAVRLDSLYRRAHGGALFCFCSARCLDQFVLDPARFAPLAPAGGEKREGATRIQPPAALRNAAPDTFPTIGTFGEAAERSPTQTFGPMARWPGAPASLGAALVPVPGTLPGARWSDVLAGIFPWRERRFARRVSRELLKLHRSISASHPELRGRDLYRTIVMARTRGDAESAEALIDQAEESFANWPVHRALRFGDVVHFIAVSEFLGVHGNSPWVHSNVGHEVSSEIPDNL